MRFTYAEFYQKFQDLDGLSDNRGASYPSLVEDGADFNQMTKNVISTQVPKGPAERDCLFGTTKIFMSTEFCNMLYLELEKAQKNKKLALNVMINSYKSFDFERKWRAFVHRKGTAMERAKELFVTWTSKIEYMRFKALLRKIGVLQVNFRMIRLKRKLRLHRYVSKIVLRRYQFYSVRKKFMRANKLSDTLQAVKQKLLMRRFFVRMKWARGYVGWIFDKSWDMIMERSKKTSTLLLQRTLRGYLDRKAAASDINKLEYMKKV